MHIISRPARASTRRTCRPFHDRFPRVPEDASLAGATLAQVADYGEHVREVAGLEHVGIGGDHDGTPSVPVGLQDVSRFPALFAELLRRGWSKDDCKAIAAATSFASCATPSTLAARTS